MPNRPPRPPEADTTPGAELICPSCSRQVRHEDSTVCAICGRRVCIACVRPYGHHMRACDECRVAEW